MAAETSADNKALRTVKIIVFTTVGLALMVSAVCWAISTRRFVARAAAAPGMVIRLNAGGSHPEIRFTTAAGQVIECPQGGMIWGCQVGDHVEVLYEPGNPTGSAVISPRNQLVESQQVAALANVKLRRVHDVHLQVLPTDHQGSPAHVVVLHTVDATENLHLHVLSQGDVAEAQTQHSSFGRGGAKPAF